MSGHKRIEQSIGEFIAARYRDAVEIGIGNNPGAARVVAAGGALRRCTDIRHGISHEGLSVTVDDIFEPDLALYAGADLLYAIRPGIEMIPSMIALARRVDADLLVYHLGFEIYENGGEIVDPGTVLRRYHRRSDQKSVD
ncbi:hypothetical protein ABH15_07260 [Methanoculleus taiwanensis]|uniref:UPF0146 protein ABH15_07260 n=1 Tax=Methanoculleus taiwanensis TaxID=1550565 RepID=A0A498GZP0_9EURY|nr:UPF0146 family protein [Methanoculleus taiwanensis]RXE55992.1 hypothetical protein ABH15_07260 [Methanoculleus taiwanensis]